MNLKIRKGKEADIHEIAKLLKKLGTYHGDKIKPNKSFLRQALMKSSLTHLLVATIEDKIVGFISGYDWMNLPQAIRVFHIDLLFVEEKSRNKNIGANLVLSACHLAQQRGCKRFDVRALKTNKLANQFYKNMDFELRPNKSNRYQFKI
jgi:ribosomal protein S18 acetylase RimI-like enzyme